MNRRLTLLLVAASIAVVAAVGWWRLLRPVPAALDTQRGMKSMALLRRIARERRSAVITVTHDHRMIEGFDTVYHLDDGRLTRAEEPARAFGAA